MKRRYIPALLAGALVAGTLATGAQQPIRVLIVDGQNNHHWQATTPILEKYLAESAHLSSPLTTAFSLCLCASVASWTGFGSVTVNPAQVNPLL